jgi:hypothetical protein
VDLFRVILLPAGLFVMGFVGAMSNRFALPKEMRPLVDALGGVALMAVALVWWMLVITR